MHERPLQLSLSYDSVSTSQWVATRIVLPLIRKDAVMNCSTLYVIFVWRLSALATRTTTASITSVIALVYGVTRLLSHSSSSLEKFHQKSLIT